MKIGDIVVWETHMRGVPVEKCGRVMQVLPPRTDPRDFIPPGYMFSSKTDSRPEVSVLVKIPKVKTIYWPEHPVVVSRKEEHRMYTQPLPASMTSPHAVTNDYDRYKVREVFKMAGNAFVERPTFLCNIDAGIRVWFSVDKDGVEFISEIERFGIGALMINQS